MDGDGWQPKHYQVLNYDKELGALVKALAGPPRGTRNPEKPKDRGKSALQTALAARTSGSIATVTYDDENPADDVQQAGAEVSMPMSCGHVKCQHVTNMTEHDAGCVVYMKDPCGMP